MIKKIVLRYGQNWHSYEITSDVESILPIEKLAIESKIEDRIFTLQAAEFVREFDKVSFDRQLPNIIDIESYSKQFLQKPNPLDSQNAWNFFKLLKEKSFLPRNFRINENNIFQYLRFIADFLKEITDLNLEYEGDRFESVEIPINRIIYNRQRKGIAIDNEECLKLIQRIEENVYSIKNELQLEYKIFVPESTKVQIEWLKKNGINVTGSLEQTFKNNSSKEPVCDLFYELIREQRDLDSLLYTTAVMGGTKRSYPSFVGFGSITSRITLREPALQNLRKTTRKIIQPDQGYEFLYIDYSQFEAGILASLSEDKELQKLYDEDIYKDISKTVWNDSIIRKDAKILFYRYMYGDRSLTADELKYFSKFKKVELYIKKIEKEAKDSKLVGSKNGNFRILNENNLSLALSHKIQATASLIFKTALITVDEKVKEAEFILPMHDAALYQVSLKSDIEDIKQRINQIFIEAFSNQCPGIKAKVNNEKFYR